MEIQVHMFLILGPDGASGQNHASTALTLNSTPLPPTAYRFSRGVFVAPESVRTLWIGGGGYICNPILSEMASRIIHLVVSVC